MSGIQKRREKINLQDTDVALVFREEGKIEASFPEITSENVPDHVMAALAISHALVDEEFVKLIRERFALKVLMPNRQQAVNDL
jgi:uncharacterized Fe-S cluster-containing protein